MAVCQAGARRRHPAAAVAPLPLLPLPAAVVLPAGPMVLAPDPRMLGGKLGMSSVVMA